MSKPMSGLAAVVAAATGANAPETMARADHDAAVAKIVAAAATEREAAVTAAISGAKAEGVSAERARISAIMTSDAAKTRPALARSVALRTDLSAEAALAVLSDAPEEKAAGALAGLVPAPKVDPEDSPAKKLSGLAAAVDAEITAMKRV